MYPKGSPQAFKLRPMSYRLGIPPHHFMTWRSNQLFIPPASMQVPLQNNAEDWKLGNLSCYDAACVARLQTKLRMDFRGIAEGTLRDCLAGNLPSNFEAMLVAETLKADPEALGRLMADHTQVKTGGYLLYNLLGVAAHCGIDGGCLC